MARMGHDSERAAMIYLHRTQGADRKIADALPIDLGEPLSGEHDVYWEEVKTTC